MKHRTDLEKDSIGEPYPSVYPRLHTVHTAAATRQMLGTLSKQLHCPAFTMPELPKGRNCRGVAVRGTGDPSASTQRSYRYCPHSERRQSSQCTLCAQSRHRVDLRREEKRFSEEHQDRISQVLSLLESVTVEVQLW